MPSRVVLKEREKPLSFAPSPRQPDEPAPIRMNLLLVSGIALVLLAATMVASTLFG
jgi:hypothetical protein